MCRVVVARPFVVPPTVVRGPKHPDDTPGIVDDRREECMPYRFAHIYQNSAGVQVSDAEEGAAFLRGVEVPASAFNRLHHVHAALKAEGGALGSMPRC